MTSERGGIITGFAILLAVVFLLLAAVCVAVANDDDETSWVPASGGDARPDPRRGCEGNDTGSCSDNRGDCSDNTGQCSDDDLSPTFDDLIICLPESTCHFEA